MAIVTLIGSGNVAWHLGRALKKGGHTIEGVYSRNFSNAKALADLFPGAKVMENLDFSKNSSDFFLLAINDTAIEEVASQVIIPFNALIAHTSGTVPLSALDKFLCHGVFYPLQTFTKGKVLNWSEVPIGIESLTEKDDEKLFILASSFSNKVQRITSAERKILHVAAVFACNFTNYLLSVSSGILKKERLDFELLKPLVQETVQKAFEVGPLNAQTGPAIRGDQKIIQQHLDYLQNESELQQLYEIFSARIGKSKQEEK